MARPKKLTVDYFPHDTDASTKKTLIILESKFGNDGYTFWFKLLEVMGDTPGHAIDCRNSSIWEFLQAKTHVSGDIARSLLDVLAKLDAIDSRLWEESEIIWSQNFVDRIADVYKNRRQDVPERPSSNSSKPLADGISTTQNPTHAVVSTAKSTQTKLNKTKLNNKDNKENVGAKIFKTFEDNFQRLTVVVSTKLNDFIDEYGEGKVNRALEQAIKYNKRNLAYVEAILEGKGQRYGKASKHSKAPTTQELKDSIGRPLD